VLAADIVKIISTDGRLAGLASFLGVALLALIAMRSFRHAIWVIGPLCLGVLWMFGVLGLFNLQFNFVNFSVLPITFGIGVDYAVNIVLRYRQEGKGSVGRVLRETGGAVALCSYTTAIGYGSMLFSDNQALQSFGRLAMWGEIACVGMALFFLPALLSLLLKKRPATPAP